MNPRQPPEPLPAATAVGRTASFLEPRLWGPHRLWLEQRPQEQGRTTLLLRCGDDGPVIELTPAPWNLRSRLHGYGGGAYAIGDGELVFVHDGDRCLWHLRLDPASGRPLAEPRRLTPPAPGDDSSPDGSGPDGPVLADGLIDPGRQRWIGVLEQGGRDQLVSVPLAGSLAGSHAPQPLHQAEDFCAYPCLSPDGSQLAWVEWQQPFMPWQRSQLWLAELDGQGTLLQPRVVAGSGLGDPRGISVFQPLWIGPHALVVASDESGWWNLQRLDTTQPGSPEWRPLLPLQAEFALPQWVSGMRTSAWDGSVLVAAACRAGCWELGQVVLEGPAAGSTAAWQPLAVPFDDLAGLDAAGGTLLALASHPTTPQGLLELELASGSWRHTPAAPAPLAAEQIEPPRALWFEGHGGARTHAWFHPPRGGATAASPLLVKGHSGPTGMARRGLQLAIQFWTSRGWGVVDVNYGGSTGFGRAYRERLDGQWGVVDVADCAAAAQALVAAAAASGQRIAIEGGSAGGFTALAALCFTAVFQAGASRYGVADPAALARQSHRFEARYLDGLIGPWPAAAATYRARSPLEHAGQIHCPVIFFQGLEDTVVPPEQTDRMAAALQARGVPVEVHRFAGEGHGFRSGSVQVQVLEATEAFFRRHFALQGLQLHGRMG